MGMRNPAPPTIEDEDPDMTPYVVAFALNCALHSVFDPQDPVEAHAISILAEDDP